MRRIFREDIADLQKGTNWIKSRENISAHQRFRLSEENVFAKDDPVDPRYTRHACRSRGLCSPPSPDWRVFIKTWSKERSVQRMSPASSAGISLQKTSFFSKGIRFHRASAVEYLGGDTELSIASYQLRQPAKTYEFISKVIVGSDLEFAYSGVTRDDGLRGSHRIVLGPPGAIYTIPFFFHLFICCFFT